MAQRIKALIAKPKDLSSIPGTNYKVGKNQLKIVSDLYTYARAGVYSYLLPTSEQMSKQTNVLKKRWGLLGRR